MAENIVIAVDVKERTLEPIALGRLLCDAAKAPAVLVTVFPYDPFTDSDSTQMARLRDEARSTLLELAATEGLAAAEAQVIAGNFAARELQRVTEQPDTGFIVVGSTTRGPFGRLLIGGIGERLLAGAGCPVAIAPRGYGDGGARVLQHIGVGLDGSQEAQRALEAAVGLAQGSGARVRVITAFQRLAFGGVGASALPSTSANDVMRRELRDTHDAAIAEARASVEADGRFIDGSADDVLVANSSDVDLLVVGSRGYGPLGAVLLGSATTVLARSASCPILVLPRETRLQLRSA